MFLCPFVFMSVNMKQRNLSFDVLKGIAIIGVVLYHFGLCTYGFLGVDIFFVVAGFFTAKSLWKQEYKTLIINGGGGI